MIRKVECMSEVKGEFVNWPHGHHWGKPGQDFMRKADLVDGAYYYGRCRNAKCARWSQIDQEFAYIRSKFGDRFPETIKHPEDDDGFDLFVPYFRCYPTEAELVSPDVKETTA